MGTALLFDRARVAEIDDWSDRFDRLGRKSILWVDLDRDDRDQLERTVASLELSPDTARRLSNENARPFFSDHGDYLHVTAFAPPPADGDGKPVELDCLFSERWVVTVHEGPVQAIDDFRERMTDSSGEIGTLDGVEFLADLLAWVLEAYLGELEAIELELEEFDERVMKGRYEETTKEIESLVGFRQRIGRLRRALVSHRGIFLALAQPELEAITSSDHAPRYRVLRDQLEQVVQVARDSREAVFGSFDVLIARTEHRTNEIMKVLTLGALLFLPGALVAGLLGMNFEVSIFETAWLFWVVCAAVLVMGATTLVFARVRRWI